MIGIIHLLAVAGEGDQGFLDMAVSVLGILKSGLRRKQQGLVERFTKFRKQGFTEFRKQKGSLGLVERSCEGL